VSGYFALCVYRNFAYESTTQGRAHSGFALSRRYWYTLESLRMSEGDLCISSA